MVMAFFWEMVKRKMISFDNDTSIEKSKNARTAFVVLNCWYNVYLFCLKL